jgi:hypothetical protein
MKYIVSMKSGAKFLVEIKDFSVLHRDMAKLVVPEAEDNLMFLDNILINISDISVIYPQISDLGD